MPIGSVKPGRSVSGIRTKLSDRTTAPATQTGTAKVSPDVQDSAKARHLLGTDRVSGTFSVPAGARRDSGLTEGKKLATEVILRFIAMSMNPEALDHPKKAVTSKTEV